MSGFRIFRIDEGYINYLNKIDNRVQFNKGERRPYVGVVLEINLLKYYVPLESPKPNHVNIKSGGPVLKLSDGRLGLMGFNNMIPVEDKHLIAFDISKEPDGKYRNLLYNQLDYCNNNKATILARALKTYEKATSGKVPHYRKICCDFARLEKSSKLYKKFKGYAYKNT